MVFLILLFLAEARVFRGSRAPRDVVLICDGVDHEDVNERRSEEHHRERTKDETAQIDLMYMQDDRQQV